MDTIRLFWFFMWRMTLWGMALGAASVFVCFLTRRTLLPLIFLMLGAE